MHERGRTRRSTIALGITGVLALGALVGPAAAAPTKRKAVVVKRITLTVGRRLAADAGER